MSKKERVQIYMDGGNFYHLVLKKLKINSLEFSFDRFVEFLVGKRNLEALGKRYYVGTLREIEGDEYSKKTMSAQTKLFAKLDKGYWQKKTSKLRIRLEKIIIDQRTLNYKKLYKKGIKEVKFTRMREKGIDVKLAVDLMVGAMDDRYDTAIIVSSDTDLAPAIDVVKYRFNKKVEYIGFSIADESNEKNDTRPSQNLIRRSDISRVLVKEDIIKFINTKITYFVHGTTNDNEKNKSTGWAQGELSKLGIKQAKKLKGQIKDKDFEVIFCSDLKRAVDSANLGFKGNCQIIQDQRLRECNYGSLNQAGKELVNYSEHISKPFSNGESLQDVEKRVKDFIEMLKKDYPGKSVAIMAHKAPQLALEVLLNNKTWEQAIMQDWRKKKAWQPGWIYIIK
jgi:alpha-ribazole phosphatase/probable phosphoglycerate mutase